MSASDKHEFDAALALLARGLAGAVEVAGLEYLPRPSFATTTTTTAAPKPPTAPTATTAPPMPVSNPTTAAEAPTGFSSLIPMAAATMAPIEPGDAPLIGAPLHAALQALMADPRPAPARLKLLNDDVIGGCTRCKLSRGRNNLVFGVGNPQARLVFVGEGPGEAEDRQGIPFVGAAGQLLTRMIDAMGYGRDDVYICNVVKCRPPNNRDPEADEVDACEGFLKAQLGVVQPDVIVGLGRIACQTLLRTQTPISKLRGTWQKYEGVDFMPTFHPSYLLREDRDPEQKRKREAWGDLKLVMQKLKKA